MALVANGDASGGQTLGKVNVNDRALVDKVLARYPKEFTVFRELIQNADDAQAEEVQIEFQTKEYAAVGGTGHVDDLNTIQLAKWVLKNDGDPFTTKDWERITNIADGNPDERKIGAFGVGFFSVFSVTDSPVIISGGIRKRMFYENNELLVESRPYASRDSRDWTTFEMDLKPEADLTMPKPFDLSRFISTAVTFLVKVKNVTVLFNGSVLSKITKSRTEPTKIELPPCLKPTSPSNAFEVTSVKAIAQQVTVNISGQAYGAGSNNPSSRKKSKPHVDPATKPSFFGKKSSESNGHHILPETSAKDFSLGYTVYSAEVCTGLSHRMASGIEAATKKKPPKTFLFEAVHFTLSEYESVHGDHDRMRGFNSVFMGPQGLLSERDGEHDAKIFIGQTTTETTGVAVHLSSRFIPTVERGSIDLANGQVRRWNEELLYIGGFMARLIYEQGMDIVRNEWSSRPDQARKEGLFLMKSFTFCSSPDSNAAGLLQKAFFGCTPNSPFPIVSNLGIRDSKDVRKPDETFATFMKQRPVLDLVPETESMIATLPKWYKVSDYTFRDIVDELNQRVFTEEEMVAFIAWWVKTCIARWGGGIADGGEEVKKQFNQASKRFRPAQQKSEHDITLVNDIRKFVDGKGWGSYIRAEDPLPPDTIPISFTSRLNALTVRTVLGWEELTIVDWIQHIACPGLSPDYKRVLEILQSLWPSLKSPEKEKIISLLQDVDCVLTTRGFKKPSEAYFPEADLFGDLPVIRPSDFNEQMLQEFGVKRFIPWSDIKERLPHPLCTPYQLAVYLDRVHDVMTAEERTELQQMAIFTGADGEFHCVADLYTPVRWNADFKLPVIKWPDTYVPTESPGYLERLIYLGLKAYPPLDVIIRKASSEENTMRKNAFTFLLANMNSVYSNYDPADFQHVAFIPCGKWSRLQLGTPEQVFVSSDWELFGFKRLHGSINREQAACLRIKDQPPASAIVKVLRENPPRDNKEAQSWFELLALKGGFTADELKDIAELNIVPSHLGGDAGSVKWVQPRKCFLGKPDDSNEHHRQLFNFVMFNPAASSFLKLCGAKPKPDYNDILEALLQDPLAYLEKAKSQKYLDDLRQVAVGYHNLPIETKARMKNAEIFLGFRRRRGPDAPRSAESTQCALRRASEILIADDMESHRLFGEYVLVAPKEEVFDNFYRAMGSANLSVHVSHTIETEGIKGGEDEDLRSRIVRRVKIFLYDQEHIRRSDVRPDGWQNPKHFRVKHCKHLRITKRLDFENALERDCSKLTTVCDALAGIETTREGNHTLWVADDGLGSGRDWYDMSVALCRLLFKTLKAHDTSSLMTILDASLDDLRRRGYDVSWIEENPAPSSDDILRRPAPAPSPLPDPRKISRPRRPFWFKDLRHLMEKLFTHRKKSGGRFLSGEMEQLADEAVELCARDDGNRDRTIHQDAEDLKRGKKQHDVKYCSASRVTDLKYCRRTRDGMAVFKTSGSSDPPSEELEAFSGVLRNLAQMFHLEPTQLHIFWQGDDAELMGFNRNHAIYLNLAHFKEKHLGKYSSDDHGKADVYGAWFLIIAHEIAHNKAFWHDEDHELLFTTIVQTRLTPFRRLLASVAPRG